LEIHQRPDDHRPKDHDGPTQQRRGRMWRGREEKEDELHAKKSHRNKVDKQAPPAEIEAGRQYRRSV
ncbi:hypothetical protein LTR22_028401, partial [Elasticomyces elasticus]